MPGFMKNSTTLQMTSLLLLFKHYTQRIFLPFDSKTLRSGKNVIYCTKSFFEFTKYFIDLGIFFG